MLRCIQSCHSGKDVYKRQPQSKRGSLRAMTHGQGQRYSRIERPKSIVRRTHQHGPGLDSRGAVPAAVRFASFIAIFMLYERGFYHAR